MQMNSFCKVQEPINTENGKEKNCSQNRRITRRKTKTKKKSTEAKLTWSIRMIRYKMQKRDERMTILIIEKRIYLYIVVLWVCKKKERSIYNIFGVGHTAWRARFKFIAWIIYEYFAPLFSRSQRRWQLTDLSTSCCFRIFAPPAAMSVPSFFVIIIIIIIVVVVMAGYLGFRCCLKSIKKEKERKMRINNEWQPGRTQKKILNIKHIAIFIFAKSCCFRGRCSE